MNRRVNTTAVLAALLAYGIASPAQPPETFAAAKRLAAEVHEAGGHQITVYCGCPYDRKGRSGGTSTATRAQWPRARARSGPTGWSGSTSCRHPG